MASDDSTGYGVDMNNNKDKAEVLHELASDLHGVYESLRELCEMLQGGGIVQARDVEPSLANAVPKLQHAVQTLNEAAAPAEDAGRNDRDGAASQSPPLM